MARLEGSFFFLLFLSLSLYGSVEGARVFFIPIRIHDYGKTIVRAAAKRLHFSPYHRPTTGTIVSISEYYSGSVYSSDSWLDGGSVCSGKESGDVSKEGERSNEDAQE